MSEKPTNSYLFRKQVPEELIERFFRVVEVEHKNDFHWWPETIVDVPTIKDKLNDLISELLPYYMTCHSYYATRITTRKHYIQILRHLAVQWGRRLDRYESTKNKMYKRGTRNYRIFAEKTEPIEGEYPVAFF
jgi:hypothetical protein